jgi:muconate cycloisomerase
MKIVSITVDLVSVPMKPDTVHGKEYQDSCHQFDWKGQFFAEVPKCIYRIATDTGLTGLGESYRGVLPRDGEASIANLLGQNPLTMNLQALPLTPGRVYDGFEIAIFDLVAKHYGMPVYQLLGGAFRKRVPVDYWTGRRSPAEVGAIAKRAQEQGFRGIKMKCALEDPHVERVRAIREQFGPDFSIVLDPNQRFENAAAALRVARSLEGFGNLLFEDPLPRWNLTAYRFLREKTSIPIALHIHLPYAEHQQYREEFVHAVRLDAIDSLNIGGGLVAFQRLGAMAEIAGIPVWHGTEVDLGILDASYVHACAATAACTLPSDIIGNFLREDDLIQEPLVYEDGEVLVPEGPGLGVELDLEALEKYRIETFTASAP